MHALSKFAIAAIIGVAAPLAPAGEALAGPLGAAASAVAPFAQPIEQTHYSGYGHHHRHYAPAYARHYRPYFARGYGAPARPYPYHTYAAPYRYHAYHSSWRSYPRHHGFGGQPHYAVAPAYSAPVSPYFTSYSAAGTVSYPVYRVDHYKVDYASPIVSYGSDCCGW